MAVLFLKEADRTLSAKRANQFYRSPAHLQKSAAYAFNSLDLDGNERLMLREAVLWALSASQVALDTANETAMLDFDQLGTCVPRSSASSCF